MIRQPLQHNGAIGVAVDADDAGLFLFQLTDDAELAFAALKEPAGDHLEALVSNALTKALEQILAGHRLDEETVDLYSLWQMAR